MWKEINIAGSVTVDEVSAAHRRETSPILRKRLKAIELLLKGKYTAKAICMSAGIKRSQLYALAQKSRTGGLTSLLHRQHGGGRNSGISKEVLVQLRAGLAQKRWQKDGDIHGWLKGLGVNISASGVRYWRRKSGFAGKRGRPSKSPLVARTRPRSALCVKLDESDLQRTAQRLGGSMTEPREKALAVILLLAALTLRRAANHNKERYLRLVLLAALAISNHTLDISRVDIAKDYEQTDWSLKQIAGKVECSRTSCYNLVRRFKKHGIEDFL